ncbi:heat-shock protein Hsp20 [Mycetocola zhujimingii]|uniref:Hsp20/alpha crystallin family protein n=2 Tax=Mycetocola zhujimingii TaxID=2079792 RepID=A0A2U1TGG3_9MICO|nr:heat-shock protein Hsp20 [Mycetocola zhujimingii]PWC07873.1 Hsp20/alpha crystallin family protein [Mycetocola zhujimingii]
MILKGDIMKNSLERFDPFAGLEALTRDFEDGILRAYRGKLPTTDVYTRGDDTLVVEAHLPNFDEDNITVNVDRGALVIQAERHEKDEDKKKKYVLRESSSSFYRRIVLPEQAEEQDISAEFKKGVLTVNVPLSKGASPRQVPIGSGSKGSGENKDG